MRIELKALQQRIGVTSIYVTHDQAEAMVLSDRLAGMNAGKIEQMGPPRQVYEKPQTKFVIDFIGTVNYIPGGVAEKKGGRLVVRATKAADASLRCPAIEGIGTGDKVLLCVRPQDIQLHQTDPGKETNIWQCTVRTAAYLGDHEDYHLELGEQTIQVSAPSSRHLRQGDTIFVEMGADAIMVQKP